MHIKELIMKHKIKSVLTLFLLLTVVYTLAIPILSQGFARDVKPPVQLNDGWKILVNGAAVTDEGSLPFYMPNKDSKDIDLYITIPETGFTIDAVSFIIYQKNAKVYVDNQLVYEKIFSPSAQTGKTPGSGTVIAPIPAGSAGKELHVSIEKVVMKDFGPISSIQLIDGVVNAYDYTQTLPFIFCMMVGLAIIGFLLLIISIYYRKLSVNLVSMMCLALVILSISLWVLCNSKMIELFTDNWVFVHNLEYISFFLVPLTFLMFVKYCWTTCSKSVLVMANIMFYFLNVAMFFKVFLSIDFFNMLPIFHFLTLCIIPVLVAEIIKNYKSRSYSFKVFCVGVLAMSTTIIAELLVYYTYLVTNSGTSIFIVGLIILSFSLIISFVIATKEKLDNSYNLKTKHNVEEEHRRYEILISNTQDIFMDWNIADDTVYFSKQFESYFGVPAFTSSMKNNIGSVLNFITYTRDTKEVYELIIDGSVAESITGYFVTKCGEERWFENSLTPIFDEDGKCSRIIGIIKDVTASKNMEKVFANQQEYLKVNQELYDNILEADITENKIIGENCVALSEMLGMPNNNNYTDIIKAITIQLTHEDFREEYEEMLSRERIISLFESGIHLFEYECMEMTSSGDYEWINLMVRIFKSSLTNTIRIISYVKNIHKEKLREMALVTSSENDSLSGLLNKGATKKHIISFLNTTDCIQHHAFIMVDVDNFKAINDTFGHAIGDMAIQAISEKLKANFRESDILGRIGGDEFAIFVKNTADVNVLAAKCQSLCSALNFSFINNDKTCPISISIGICQYPHNGTTYDELYKNADIALYYSKEHGRNTYTFYTNASISF